MSIVDRSVRFRSDMVTVESSTKERGKPKLTLEVSRSESLEVS